MHTLVAGLSSLALTIFMMLLSSHDMTTGLFQVLSCVEIPDAPVLRCQLGVSRT